MSPTAKVTWGENAEARSSDLGPGTKLEALSWARRAFGGKQEALVYFQSKFTFTCLTDEAFPQREDRHQDWGAGGGSWMRLAAQVFLLPAWLQPVRAQTVVSEGVSAEITRGK